MLNPAGIFSISYRYGTSPRLGISSQDTLWLRMQFSGSFDRCVLVVHHTDMPASQYPLQRAGVDVEHPDFSISTRYRDEVPIHAHVFYALVITATNYSFRSAGLHIRVVPQ